MAGRGERLFPPPSSILISAHFLERRPALDREPTILTPQKTFKANLGIPAAEIKGQGTIGCHSPNRCYFLHVIALVSDSETPDGNYPKRNLEP
jgi:hypothetical protein